MTYHDILDEAALERSTSQYIRKDISEHKEGEPYVILYASKCSEPCVHQDRHNKACDPPKYGWISYDSVTGKPKELGTELTRKIGIYFHGTAAQGVVKIPEQYKELFIKA